MFRSSGMLSPYFPERVCCRLMQLRLKVMALMGFRLGEALAMRAKYIDLSRRLYHVIEAQSANICK